MRQPKVRARLHAHRHLFDRARPVVPRRPRNRNVGRVRLVGRDEVVLRQPHLLAFIRGRHMVRAILLHVDGAVIDVPLTAGQMHLLAVVQRQHPVLQRGRHRHRQRRVRAFQRAQIASLVLRHRLHARPLRIVVGHLHRLHRRQVHHAKLEMLRGRRARLHVVLHVLRQSREQKLEARAVHLRLHRHRLPLRRARVLRVQAHLVRGQPDHLRRHHLVAVAPHRLIARLHHNLVDRRHILVRPGPQQRCPIAHESRPRRNHPHQHRRAHHSRAQQPHQSRLRDQTLRLCRAGIRNLQRVRRQQLQK